MTHLNEDLIEQAALGYTIVFGNDIAPGNTLASLRGSLLPKLMRGK